MLTFEDCVIKKFWPADDKGEDDEIIRQIVIQADVAIDNGRQVGELYNNMVRGLVKVLLFDNLTGEEYVLPAATIKPFNVKQKKVRVGKGDEADIVKSEYAAINIVARIPEDKGGEIIADVYRFFNIQIQLGVEEIDPFDKIRQDNDSDVEQSFTES